MFKNMFDGYLTSFEAKQQQENSLLIYLPIIVIATGTLFIINKK